MPSRRPKALSPPAVAISVDVSDGVILPCSVNAAFTHCQRRVDAGLNDAFSIVLVKDEVTERVRAELRRRKKGPGDLAKGLGYERQRAQNWFGKNNRGGIPRAEYPPVAEYLGWSVERLLGEHERNRSEWPFRDVPERRVRSLSPSNLMRLEALLLEELDKMEPDRPARASRPAPHLKPV